MNVTKTRLAALAATVLLAAVPAFAKGHDSNTLHKIGKAIQYPVRKDTSNLSVDTHRALKHKSVVHRRNGNKTYRSVVTPGGHVKRLHRVRHRYPYHPSLHRHPHR
jgi:hypothetical protein